MEGDGGEKEGGGIHGTGHDIGGKHCTSDDTGGGEGAHGEGRDGSTIEKGTGDVELRRKREGAENEIV